MLLAFVVYFMSQVLDTISTLETVKVMPSWSIFMPELLPLAEPLALWSDAGRLPPVGLELPVPLAEGALLEAEGLVLALPLAVVPVPGALSLIAPPLPEAVVVLLVLLPAGEVVVVFSLPPIPELLALDSFAQSP